MSLFKALRIAAVAGAMVGVTAVLSGCSFSPVYSGALATQPSFQLAYAKPNSRLEQVIYQELSLRLGSSTSETAPLASVSIGAGEADLVLSQTQNPNKPREVTVTANLTITPRDGSATPVQTYTRRATSNYTRTGQVLADNAASIDAFERAAKSAAESLRLAVPSWRQPLVSALKAHEVARFIVRPDITEGIFLAYGPDAGLVRETAQKLIRQLTGNDPASASITVLEAAEVDADPSTLAVAARTMSLFGGKNIIRVRGAGKSIVMTLAEIRDDPGAAIVLEAGNLAAKDALRALVEAAKLGRALPCYPDSDEAIQALIKETFNQHAIRYDGDVITTLCEILGNDREITRRELEKLVLYAASSKTLTRDDVLLLCADNGMMIIDAIVDATGSGHAEKLELALNRALTSAVDPQRLLAVCTMHFAALRRWRAEVDGGKSPRAVLDGQRPKPHFSRMATLEQQLRLWSDGALAAATDRILQTVAETRRRPAIAEASLRRALLAICMMAAAH